MFNVYTCVVQVSNMYFNIHMKITWKSKKHVFTCYTQQCKTNNYSFMNMWKHIKLHVSFVAQFLIYIQQISVDVQNNLMNVALIPYTYNQCSSLQAIGHCLIFCWQMAWNFEDFQHNFILKCIRNCCHCYCKSCKNWQNVLHFSGASKITAIINGCWVLLSCLVHVEKHSLTYGLLGGILLYRTCWGYSVPRILLILVLKLFPAWQEFLLLVHSKPIFAAQFC